ncbi:glycosyltransferase family 2 protein [Candidatus Saccharibacteria bacterium]|nr:glycosyltransferase family 2 protein [Candidatus Saccharibacteria bacterium]
MTKSTDKPVVVIPNLNGGEDLLLAIGSLQKQTLKPHIIVVDNASTDGSVGKALKEYPNIELIQHTKNKGYTGGVNPGLKRAIELGASYAAPFNDDAVADTEWLEKLVTFLNERPNYGAACCKVLKSDKKTLDSTGDYVTVWGLPYPRGRDEKDSGQYDAKTDIFAASGAASLFRIEALKRVGLFDEDYFAYYEDVDLGFRLQLAGWKIGFVPTAKVYHKVGMTSGRIKGFTTTQTLKNIQLLIWKNVPTRYLFSISLRYTLAEILFFGRAITRGQLIPAAKGLLLGRLLLLKKIPERRWIKAHRKVSPDYIWGILVHDLPPNARALRTLRRYWWRLVGKSE